MVSSVTDVEQNSCVMQSYTERSREQKHQGNRMLYYAQNVDMLQESIWEQKGNRHNWHKRAQQENIHPGIIQNRKRYQVPGQRDKQEEIENRATEEKRKAMCRREYCQICMQGHYYGDYSPLLSLKSADRLIHEYVLSCFPYILYRQRTEEYRINGKVHVREIKDGHVGDAITGL